mgnify:FL=1
MDVDKMLLNKIKNLKMYKIISSNYKLNKRNMFNNKIYIPDCLLNTDKNIGDIIINYISVISKVISNEYLYILSNNIRSVKLSKQNISSDEIDIKQGSFHAGGYYCEKNEIIYYDESLYKYFFKNDYIKALKQILTHELFHLSSTKIKDNNVYSGLSYNITGNALNEGYTELLTNNLFNYNHILTNYEYEKRIAFLISNFLGSNNMNKIYFTTDNKKMIMLLNEYSTYKNTNCFLKELDFINENKKNKDINIHNKVISYHIDIINYILDIHTNKLIELLNDNLISKDIAIDNLTFLALFLFDNSKYIYSIKEEDIRLLNNEIINNILNNYIDKINNIRYKILSK